MFRKLVVLEPVRFDEAAERELATYAEEVVFYRDNPRDNAEIIRRIGDADAFLVFFTTRIEREVIEACPNLRYIGMCCSLYTPESANVDIRAAEERGITVRGIRDYGDEGLVEFVITYLVKLLHGFEGPRWKEEPTELTGRKVGIIGYGRTGSMVADALRYFGAEVYYYNRSRKPEAEAKGVRYLPLDELLQTVDIISTHLHKNTVLLYERELELYGNGKILVNTTVTPPYPIEALSKWLEQPGNYFICDEAVCVGGVDSPLYARENVLCPNLTSGRSNQSADRLRRKVLDNIRDFLGL